MTLQTTVIIFCCVLFLAACQSRMYHQVTVADYLAGIDSREASSDDEIAISIAGIRTIKDYPRYLWVDVVVEAPAGIAIQAANDVSNLFNSAPGEWLEITDNQQLKLSMLQPKTSPSNGHADPAGVNFGASITTKVDNRLFVVPVLIELRQQYDRFALLNIQLKSGANFDVLGRSFDIVVDGRTRQFIPQPICLVAARR